MGRSSRPPPPPSSSSSPSEPPRARSSAFPCRAAVRPLPFERKSVGRRARLQDLQPSSRRPCWPLFLYLRGFPSKSRRRALSNGQRDAVASFSNFPNLLLTVVFMRFTVVFISRTACSERAAFGAFHATR